MSSVTKLPNQGIHLSFFCSKKAHGRCIVEYPKSCLSQIVVNVERMIMTFYYFFYSTIDFGMSELLRLYP